MWRPRRPSGRGPGAPPGEVPEPLRERSRRPSGRDPGDPPGEVPEGLWGSFLWHAILCVICVRFMFELWTQTDVTKHRKGNIRKDRLPHMLNVTKNKKNIETVSLPTIDSVSHLSGSSWNGGPFPLLLALGSGILPTVTISTVKLWSLNVNNSVSWPSNVLSWSLLQ